MLKEYKRISFICFGVIVGISTFFLCTGVIWGPNKLWLIYLLFSCGFAAQEVRRRLFLGINQIKKKYQKDLDIEYACNMYECIIEKKYLLGRQGALSDYLLLLLYTCQIEKLITIYKKNRGLVRTRQMRSYLEWFWLECAALLEDRNDYQMRLSKYCFSNYYKHKGKLSEIYSAFRLRDKTVEILQLYEKRKYQEVLEKLEHICVTKPWNILYFQSIKERCLYHLNEEYSVPEQEQTKYLFIKQWDTLIKTGKEYNDERMNEIIDLIKKDMSLSKVKDVLWVVGTCVMILVLVK